MLIKTNKKQESKRIRILANVTLLLVLLGIFIPSLEATGVARSYWDGYPLKLAPGESKIVSLRLQNMPPPEEEVIVQATLESEIAAITDENTEYIIPSGSRNTPVNIEVTIPKDAIFGKIYDVAISFRQISSGEGGMVSLATGFTTSFPVEVVGFGESENRVPVVEEEKSKSISVWVVVAIVLAIAITANIVIRKIQANKKK